MAECKHSNPVHAQHPVPSFPTRSILPSNGRQLAQWCQWCGAAYVREHGEPYRWIYAWNTAPTPTPERLSESSEEEE